MHTALYLESSVATLDRVTGKGNIARTDAASSRSVRGLRRLPDSCVWLLRRSYGSGGVAAVVDSQLTVTRSRFTRNGENGVRLLTGQL